MIEQMKNGLQEATQETTGEVITVEKELNRNFFKRRTLNERLLEAKHTPIPRELYPELIFENEITILFANAGVGKSIFAMQIAHKISQTDKVLYFDLELSDKQVEKRYSDNYENHYKFNDNLIHICFEQQITIPKGFTYDTYFIKCLVDEVKATGAKIIIIDNMSKLIGKDTDKATDAKPLMDILCHLKFKYGLTMLLLEHERKTIGYTPISMNDLQGSKMKANFADAIFAIGVSTKSTKGKEIRYIKQLKCRSSEMTYGSDNVPVFEIVKETNYIYFKFIEYSREFEHLKQQTTESKVNRKQEAAELRAQGLSNVKIGDHFGVDEKTIRNWLK